MKILFKKLKYIFEVPVSIEQIRIFLYINFLRIKDNL